MAIEHSTARQIAPVEAGQDTRSRAEPAAMQSTTYTQQTQPDGWNACACVSGPACILHLVRSQVRSVAVAVWQCGSVAVHRSSKRSAARPTNRQLLRLGAGQHRVQVE